MTALTAGAWPPCAPPAPTSPLRRCQRRLDGRRGHRPIDRMMVHGVALVETARRQSRLRGHGRVAHCPVPVVADESVQTLADVEQLAAAGVGGINLKLMKVRAGAGAGNLAAGA